MDAGLDLCLKSISMLCILWIMICSGLKWRLYGREIKETDTGGGEDCRPCVWSWRLQRSAEDVGCHRHWTDFRYTYCPLPFAKVGDIKTHSSVCPSVTKTLTWLIFSEVLMIEHKWYLACMILVTSPLYWNYAVTLTFDLLQGQICCQAGHHNSLSLLVLICVTVWKLHFNTHVHVLSIFLTATLSERFRGHADSIWIVDFLPIR